MEHISSNAIKLSSNLYVVNNQNGVEQSLYDYFGHNSNEQRYSKKEIRKMLQNYPKRTKKYHSRGLSVYPCAFVIIDQTFECGRIYLDIVPPFTFDELVHSGNYRRL